MISSRASLLALTLFVAALPFATSRAQEAPPQAAEAEMPTAPVRFDGRTLFTVRGTSSFPAELRAAAIAAKIAEAARDPAISPDAIRVVPSPLGREIRGGDLVITGVVPADAELESMQIEVLAELHRRRISTAIAQYRAEREPARLLRGLALSLVATGLFAAAAFVVGRGLRKVEAFAERRIHAHLARMERGTRELVEPSPFLAVLRAMRWVTLLALVYLWLEFVLRQFPWTRPLGERLLALLLDPIEQLVNGFIDFLPSLMFLLVLAIVTRYALRILRRYFTALDRGYATLANFEPQWALPAYKIVRTVAIALALVMAYPYLPGSGSEALQGISVLGGLMLSLGASGAVSNVIAGYFNTFGRILRVGDVIQVGDVRGEITDVRLLTTRVRTVKNEEVTLPNASIISNYLINYSALAKSRGLILHTEVGIGYEVPWRQVHAMLEEAARRTPSLLREPPPFVLQRQLGDFAVVYQLNAYTDTAQGMALTYSALHQNILDIFNEHGVQIMTPAYEGDPTEPKVVARERWFAEPARPPLDQDPGARGARS